MTDDQLKAMENSAPMLVAEVRKLQAQLRAEELALEEANKKLRTIHQAMEVLLGVAVGPSPGVRG